MHMRGGEMRTIRIHFDRDYGCDNRTGWSIAVDGSFYSELERFLLVVVAKAIYHYWFVIDKEYR